MHRTLISVVLGLAAATLASPALAAVPTAAQDEMIPPASVMMSGVPYGSSGGSDGQYIESGTYYNSAPVYQRSGGSGTTWSLYKRTDGKWYVDFNTVSEDWDGTVAYTSGAQSWPWSNSWTNSVVSYRTTMVNVQNIPYAVSHGSAGDYEETGEIYNGAPVYEHAGLSGSTWSLYKRADGKWYVDFNAVSEDWDGTVAYLNASEWPWSATWNNASYVFTNTKIVYLNGLPYPQLGSNGDFTYAGTTYNNAPVYTRVVGGGTWSLYKRADGKWYVDGNAVGEAWDGTMAYTNAAQSHPWSGGSGSWANSVIAFRTARATVQGTPYASNGSAGEYLASGQIYNNAPVYQRVAGSTIWSLYKRANGKWHVDFNAVSEDWDGTVAYTTAAMDMPWSSASWNASTVVEDLFAD